MRTVFVVLGESGEYSDRMVWVSGVFETRKEAEGAAVKQLAASRVYAQWWDAVCNIRRRMCGGWISPETLTKEIEHESERLAGPTPEYEPADRVTIFEVPIGTWIKDVAPANAEK